MLGSHKQYIEVHPQLLLVRSLLASGTCFHLGVHKPKAGGKFKGLTQGNYYIIYYLPEIFLLIYNLFSPPYQQRTSPHALKIHRQFGQLPLNALRVFGKDLPHYLANKGHTTW